MGDFRLSPAYDLLNSRIHIADKDFALDDGLFPKPISKGNVKEQFYALGEIAGISILQIDRIFSSLTNNRDKVNTLVEASFLTDRIKGNFKQAYQTRFNKLLR